MATMRKTGSCRAFRRLCGAATGTLRASRVPTCQRPVRSSVPRPPNRTNMKLLSILLAAAALLGATDAPPVFPYGAVYFRKSNPPEAEWARDHQTAARIGMNTFRHWFMWGAIEAAPGKYDWRDYDRMMELGAQNGIKVIIAELI